MANVDARENDTEELDPAAERLRRKMLRLMAVSIGTMFIAIFAVLFAIVYKLNTADSGENARIDASIDLPQGFEINETIFNDGKIYMRGVDESGNQKILIFDALDGADRGSISIE